MNSTASNKKFTTDFSKGSIKSKVIGGVGSLGRVKWKVVSIARQQPLKTSLETSCCACWGRGLVCCTAGELCAFHIPLCPLDGSSVLTHVSTPVLRASQTHTRVSLGPSKYPRSILTPDNTTCASTDGFQSTLRGKKIMYGVFRVQVFIWNLYFPENSYFSPSYLWDHCRQKSPAGGLSSSNFPEELKFGTCLLRERQIKFPATVWDGRRSIVVLPTGGK